MSVAISIFGGATASSSVAHFLKNNNKNMKKTKRLVSLEDEPYETIRKIGFNSTPRLTITQILNDLMKRASTLEKYRITK